MAVKKKGAKKPVSRSKTSAAKEDARPKKAAKNSVNHKVALDSPKVVRAEIVDTPPAEDQVAPIFDDSDAYLRRDPVALAVETDGSDLDVVNIDPMNVDSVAADSDPAEGSDLSTPRDSRRKKRLPVPVTGGSSGVSSEDPVTTYLAEIRKYPLISRQQEYDLAVRYRETGDSKAAEELVTANLRFVVKIATEYSKFGAKLIDLIQEGNVGLMHAVREFNPYKGVRLITYAVWWIRGYIQEYLMRQYSMVRIGTTQNQRKLFYRLQKEKVRLDSLGQDPTVPLLSSRLGVSEEEVRQMSQRLSGRDVSLNQPLDFESSASLLDMEASHEPGVDEQLGNAEQLEVLRENIERIRPQLNKKELYILDKRILSEEPLTLQEIGEHYGVTREAVRQLEARLIKRIRSAFVASTEATQLVGPDNDSDDEI